MHPHQMSAVALLDAYRARRALAGRSDARRARSRRDVRAAPPRDLICSRPSARSPTPAPRKRAGRRASRSGRSTACRPPSRTTSPPGASRGRSARRRRPDARRRRRAARRAAARSGRDPLRQDDDARLRHAVVRACRAFTRWRATPGTSRATPAVRPRAPARRRRRATARCISAPTSAARCACRPAGAAFRPQAEPGPRADRSALHRPRRRADDAHRRRRRADDGDAVAARRARRHEPAARRRSTGRRAAPNLRGLRIGLLLDAGCGLPPTPEVRAAVERAARDFEAAGAHVEPMAPFLTQDDARRPRPLLAHALAGRHRRACRRSGARRCCPSSAPGPNRRAALSGERFSAASARSSRCAKRAVAATQPFDFVLSPTAPITAFPAELRLAEQRPAEPVRAYRLHRPLQHVGAAGRDDQLRLSAEGLPIGLQIVGRRFDDLGVLAVAQAYEVIPARRRASLARAAEGRASVIAPSRGPV